MNNNDLNKKIESLVKEAYLKQESINNGLDSKYVVEEKSELNKMLSEENISSEKHK